MLNLTYCDWTCLRNWLGCGVGGLGLLGAGWHLLVRSELAAWSLEGKDHRLIATSHNIRAGQVVQAHCRVLSWCSGFWRVLNFRNPSDRQSLKGATLLHSAICFCEISSQNLWTLPSPDDWQCHTPEKQRQLTHESTSHLRDCLNLCDAMVK